MTRTAGELDSLLSDIGGDKGALNTLNKLKDAKQNAEQELAGLLERLQQRETGLKADLHGVQSLGNGLPQGETPFVSECVDPSYRSDGRARRNRDTANKREGKKRG